MKNQRHLFILIAVVFVLQGCGTGYNRATVSSISNIGFDMETAPAKVEGSVSSYEGMVMPAFEGGQTVPLISATSTHGNRLEKFFRGRSSTVASGDAAYTMGYLYADCNRNVTPVQDIPDVVLTQKPSIVPGPGTVKPLVFATNSMLGAGLRVSKDAPLAFSSFKVGFNRKEEISTPILVEPSREQPGKVIAGTASLIGTMDYDIDLQGEGEETNRYRFFQYFATGEAANHLALRSDVRHTMYKRIKPYMHDSFCEDDLETKTR